MATKRKVHTEGDADWLVKDFPVKLRLRARKAAKKGNITLTKFVADAVRQALST